MQKHIGLVWLWRFAKARAQYLFKKQGERYSSTVCGKCFAVMVAREPSVQNEYVCVEIIVNGFKVK